MWSCHQLVVFIGILLVSVWSFQTRETLSQIPRYVPPTAFIPKIYPLYLQCDPQWGNDLMGGDNPTYDTICIQGCAMSSLSMALSGKGYLVPPSSAPMNPGTFNSWLRSNGGYLCIGGNCNNLNLTTPDNINPGRVFFIGEKEKPSLQMMKNWVNLENPIMIGHVRNNSHFVLIVGYDKESPNVFYVNDPFYNTSVYLYNDFSDLISYVVIDQPPSDLYY